MEPSTTAAILSPACAAFVDLPADPSQVSPSPTVVAENVAGHTVRSIARTRLCTDGWADRRLIPSMRDMVNSRRTRLAPQERTSSSADIRLRVQARHPSDGL